MANPKETSTMESVLPEHIQDNCPVVHPEQLPPIDPAKYRLRICTNVYCMLGGGDEVFEQVCKHFGISNRQATADGLVSVEEIPCMGACEGAPVVAVNDQFYEGVTISDLPELLAELKD